MQPENPIGHGDTSTTHPPNDNQKTIVSAMLHPQVKLALAYLDCHLEDELLRYRRARSGSQVVPSSARVMRSSGKEKTPVELTQFIPIDALPKKAIDAGLLERTIICQKVIFQCQAFW